MSNLTFADIETVLNNMTNEERLYVETQGIDLRESIRIKIRDDPELSEKDWPAETALGRQGSLELIAKLGMFMNEHDWDGDV